MHSRLCQRNRGSPTCRSRPRVPVRCFVRLSPQLSAMGCQHALASSANQCVARNDIRRRPAKRQKSDWRLCMGWRLADGCCKRSRSRRTYVGKLVAPTSNASLIDQSGKRIKFSPPSADTRISVRPRGKSGSAASPAYANSRAIAEFDLRCRRVDAPGEPRRAVDLLRLSDPDNNLAIRQRMYATYGRIRTLVDL